MVEEITTLANQIVQLSKRLQDIETKMQSMAAVTESFKKLGAHAATCSPESVKSELKSLNADMLEMTKKIEAMREALATGHGMQQKVTLGKSDYAEMLPARLAQASLKEVYELVSGGQ